MAGRSSDRTIVTLTQKIFYALADGSVHSGEALAESAGVTRSAVWKAIEQLRELGLEIEAQTNRGYRLTVPCEPLEAKRIRASLSSEVRATTDVLVEWETESTNAVLLAATPPPAGQFVALLTENQTGGRGRRGRAWRSALGGSLCLSIATSFEPLPRDLPALTLVIGACVREALLALGAKDLALKWPNDLVTRSAPNTTSLIKLGGILVELRAEAGGPGHVVVGVGLNLRLDEEAKATIAKSGTIAGDLRSQGIDVAARNRLVGAVIDRCVEGLVRFSDEGFAPFIAGWRAADALRDQPVRVFDGADERNGIARGIDSQGALQLETADGRRTAIFGGEVSVRPRGTR